MPVRDSMPFLPKCIPPLLRACERHGAVEVVYVDNGSVDDTRAYLESHRRPSDALCRIDHASVGALRNFAASRGTGGYLSFIDADCEVGEDYFAAALTALRRSGAAGTGHPYALPPSPGWIERTWHDLHDSSRPRDVAYLPAGNLFITRAAFERVGGFREDLASGEDAELGQRLTAAGDRLYADPDVRAVHHGNPRTVRQFYRRAVWHGLGMFGTVRRGAIDKPTAMMAVHLLATLACIMVAGSDRHWLTRIGAVVALQGAVPVATIVYRMLHARRWALPVRGAFLYWLYYWARLQALGLLLLKRGYRK